MTILTEEQKRIYLNVYFAGNCPVCASENIEAGHLDADGCTAYSKVECNDCGATWYDVYTLTSVDSID